MVMHERVDRRNDAALDDDAEGAAEVGRSDDHHADRGRAAPSTGAGAGALRRRDPAPAPRLRVGGGVRAWGLAPKTSSAGAPGGPGRGCPRAARAPVDCGPPGRRVRGCSPAGNTPQSVASPSGAGRFRAVKDRDRRRGEKCSGSTFALDFPEGAGGLAAVVTNEPGQFPTEGERARRRGPAAPGAVSVRRWRRQPGCSSSGRTVARGRAGPGIAVAADRHPAGSHRANVDREADHGGPIGRCDAGSISAIHGDAAPAAAAALLERERRYSARGLGSSTR